MNKFIMFIFAMLAFLGCDKKSLTSKSLAKSIVSLIVDGTFDDKSFGEDAWKGAQMLEEDFGVEIIDKASTSTAYASDLEILKIKVPALSGELVLDFKKLLSRPLPLIRVLIMELLILFVRMI